MTENPNDPLTPLELFQRGIEMTRAIRGRVEESRAYYLGRSSCASGQLLSVVFDPTRGPILKYFIETIRTINKTCNQRTDGSTVTKRREVIYGFLSMGSFNSRAVTVAIYCGSQV